ncbi:MAG TPA: ATP-binding protein, partial [Solirubrobacteraceae bacterium]|nr:ATP-binding protein [Solirubrobacteraceae bacterium]
RLVDRLASERGQACAEERLSAGRAGVAAREQWLHWIDEAESREPWADGEWAPRAGLLAERGSAGPLAVEQHPGALVERIHVPPGPGSSARAASWVAPALPVCVGPLCARLVSFAEAHLEGESLIADLKLSASEAITNVVLHAYRDHDRPGTVAAGISTDRTAGRAEVVVTDTGVGMSRRPDSPGAGLGLSIMTAICDQVTIRPGSTDVGTEVRLIFAVRRGPTHDGHGHARAASERSPAEPRATTTT